MHVSDSVQCSDFPCGDVRRESYGIPAVEIDPQAVRMALISEAAPADPADGYYSGQGSLFAATTLQAFQEAGLLANSIEELLARGIYLTSAVKCGKTGYGLQTATVVACSYLLERELALFPNIEVYLLMGDMAIKAFNALAKRQGAGRVIPSGSTYKIRGQSFYFQGKRVFPSYLQAGPSFYIEKSKRRMIAEDLTAALECAGLR